MSAIAIVPDPALDIAAAAERFAEAGRAQIDRVLAADCAEALRARLRDLPDWGKAWGVAGDGPHLARPGDTAPDDAQLGAAVAEGRLAYRYGLCPVSDAAGETWTDAIEPEALLAAFHDAAFLDLARAVTGIASLAAIDVQATLYEAGDFLSRHDDEGSDAGWRVAFVLNLTDGAWGPDCAGQLLFHDGDRIAEAFAPRFNSLALFRVPQDHSVSYVPPFAPVRRRYALSGWLKDRPC
ncbi:2OG-Fe(II) oxygenase [Allosphingosinicella indica]|uniref:Proline 4-hydroxylase (Includes Rps23 Pro-64 3,4-dihydroxylase Tpa1), contains SM-20 domain n=1 Tax=Allosphingosinicella indica TaxID=941907 RepID=A0A1X7FZ24_9SPHN|nr:2OG-Fe(II) oxygenase family protein [Allosphingosinicella indica]SMF61342.1 Proline 4-hydroxylase (includes Rps23 Pro-64 3,4-dihydroxylase Tpa1), contains SM-20 domain [Allosphingosinicella indica]